jgi:diguanylate cyclase (GGDEF)-like protein/PAS domain S-box-containing protein
VPFSSTAITEALWRSPQVAIFIVRIEWHGNKPEFIFEGLNPAHERALGLSNDWIRGRTIDQLDGVPRDIRDQIRRNYEQAIDAGSYTYDERISCNGKVTYWQTSLTAACTNGDRPDTIIGTAIEVTQRVELARQLEENACIDPLTETRTRQLFDDTLERMVKAASKGDHPFAVLFLDVDKFKHINDIYGHAEGDRVLQIIARRIESQIREGDLLSRRGGDEFTVILKSVEDQSYAEFIANRIQESVSEPIVLGCGTRIEVRISVGAAIADGTESADQILQYADQAMYEIKSSGSAVLLKDLSKALERNEFELHYQSIRDIQSPDCPVVGYEALIRWSHNGVMIPPPTFLRLVEHLDMMLPLTEWVIGQALRDRQKLPSHLYISVNISPSLSTDAIKELLIDLPNFLQAEITEGFQMRAGLPGLLHYLGDRGLRLALDDFGTGFSTLAALRIVPWTIIKIDQSFINDRSLLQWLSNLKNVVGAYLVLEGIETQEQLEYARRCGIHGGQGWLFDAARPLNEILKCQES